jgi:hypothetical protein
VEGSSSGMQQLPQSLGQLSALRSLDLGCWCSE